MMRDALKLAEYHLGCVPENMRPVEHVTNNSVFTFNADGNRYIFKFYKSKYWPEDGKLPFVNRILGENGIPCARLKVFNRDNADYPNGYLIEQKLEGISADKVSLEKSAEKELYEKLAEFMSLVHRIELGKFGYIGDGSPDYDSMSDFFEDEFDDRGEILIEKGIFTESEIRSLKEKLRRTLVSFGDLPAVLCHGDLSKKNIMMQDSGKIMLIDWDDAMAYCWMADVSRFTFWLKMNYSKEVAAEYRSAFLDSYRTDYRKEDFTAFEEGIHIYIALDFLAFYLKTDDTAMQIRLEDYLRRLL